MNLLMTVMAVLVMTIFPGDIESIANKHDLIDKAECLVYTDTIVIALKTQPIFFRSDRIKLIETIKSEVKDNYDVSEVIISFDRDIYYKITKIDEQRAKGVSEDKLRAEIIYLIDTARDREA